MKRALGFILPILITLTSFAWLAYIVLTYTPHTDAGFGAALITGALVAIEAVVFIAVFIKNGDKKQKTVCAVCLIVCALLLFAARTVPNCPMCDGWKEGEFHLFSHWIKSDL